MCKLRLHFQYLRLSFRVTSIGAEVEASRVHAAGAACHIRAHGGHVTLCGHLHLVELSSERYNCSPERQQTAVLIAEVLVERLTKTQSIKSVKHNNVSLQTLHC